MSDRLSNIHLAAIQLETAAASLAGVCGRGNHDEIDKATEKYNLDVSLFRHELESATGITASQIQLLLNL